MYVCQKVNTQKESKKVLFCLKFYKIVGKNLPLYAIWFLISFGSSQI